VYNTTMSKRTDIHRPGAIVPANYTYYTSYALATTVDSWPVPPWNVELVLNLQATRPFAKTGGLGKCSICGANFIYGDIWVHEPTGEHLHVGHDCAAKYEMLADRSQFELEHGRLKAATATQALKAHNAEIRKAFLDAHEGLEAALATNHPIIRDLNAKLVQFKDLTEKQIALALKIAHEVANPAPQEVLVPAPVANGRQTFQGTVVSAKAQEGLYGTQYRMTVKVATPAGNWLAWGTCPSALLDSVPCGQKGRLDTLRGCEVEVTATLKPGREAHFAVMNRPAGKVTRLTAEAERLSAELKAMGIGA
jgi:hypothetical protein